MTIRIDASDQASVWGLFAGVTRYALRVEAKQHYGGDAEDVERFLSGDVTLPEAGRWEALVAEHTAAGRPFQRVRVVEEPWTDYVTWELHSYAVNRAAGEEIRILVVHDSIEWPDFWIVDDELWVMAYDRDARLDHMLRDNNSQLVLAGGEALRRSVPLDDYLARKLRAVS